MDYIEIEFKSAKYIPPIISYVGKPLQNEFFIVDKKSTVGVVKTVERQVYKETIVPEHIINMMHVLCGERPVPSLREVTPNYPKLLSEITDAVMKGVIKHTHLETDSLKHIEFNSGKKPHWNTTPKKEYHSWAVIKESINDDVVYNGFIDILKKVTKRENVTDVFTLNDVKSFFTTPKEGENKNQDNINMFLEWYDKQKNITPLYHFLLTNQGRTFLKNRVNKKIINNPIFYTVVDGKIYIPLTDFLKNKIIKNVGTILDGGVAVINKIVDARDINTDGYKRIKDISNEKTSLFYSLYLKDYTTPKFFND